MSTPEIIDTPAACIKCGFITDSPTTGKTQNKCPCCGGLLISVNKLTPGENVIVLAKRASWECSNDDGEWYGRRTTEEQIIKHFAPLGAELATLRAQLAAKEQDAKRMAADNLEILDKLEELAVTYGKLQDAHATLQQQHQRAVEDSARLDTLCSLLAGAWLYGGWKAETCAEGEMQTILRNRGWWPITEKELVAKRAAIDAARKEDKP